MSIFGLKFIHPYLLLLILLVIPVYLFLRFRVQKSQQIPYPPIQYKPASKWPHIIFLLTILLDCLMITATICSIAGPHHSYEIVSVEEEGIDVMIVVDISSSMQATDFTPTRLEATKKIIQEFVRKSGGNRLGIAVFGKHIFTLSPMTTSKDVLHTLVDGISLQSINHNLSGGTAIGDALIYSVDILRNAKIDGRAQVLVLLTDGENNLGASPLLGAKFAAFFTYLISSLDFITLSFVISSDLSSIEQ